MLKRYEIVLVAFPFTDGPAAKPRPATQPLLGSRVSATIRTLQAALNTSHSSDVTPSRSVSSAGGQP